VARYLFKPSEKLLYYAEIPFDPYHSEPIEQFMKLEPGKKKSWPAFQSMEAAQFAFAFGGEKGALENQWNDEKQIPAVVGVRWSDGEAEGKTVMIVPNSFFPRDTEQESSQQGFDRKRKR
jgi:hypothetical protein